MTVIKNTLLIVIRLVYECHHHCITRHTITHKGEEFRWSYPYYFSKSFFVKPNHTLIADILFNQSEASKSQLVSSLSAYESKQSITACLTLAY